MEAAITLYVCMYIKYTKSHHVLYLYISQHNTFQVILLTDGTTSYSVFLYNSIAWGDGGETIIGFNDGTRFYTLAGGEGVSAYSSVDKLPSTSNVGVDGVYIFRTDSSKHLFRLACMLALLFICTSRKEFQCMFLFIYPVETIQAGLAHCRINGMYIIIILHLFNLGIMLTVCSILVCTIL